jgi:hypothetical protein
MDEAKPVNWDLIVKIVGLVALIASGMWTLYKFRQDHEEDINHSRESEYRDTVARKQELNRFVFEKQASLYFDAADAAATIASTDDKASIKAARVRFYQLYWGEMPLVEDERVQLAMVAFKACLESDRTPCERIVKINQNLKPLSQETLDTLPTPDLKNLSLQLAACMRSALTHDRGISFGEIIDPRVTCPYE